MDADSLDLCISCGSHVADGTPYCSLRCQSQDQSSLHLYASATTQGSSSSQRYPYASSSSAAYPYNPRRRPLLNLQEQPTSLSSEDIPYAAPTAHKLASIAEWAKGVWGEAGDEEDEDVLHMRSRKSAPTPIPVKKSSSTPSKSSPTRSSHRSQGSLSSYTPPRFTLTAQHLAPPAMSIATTTNNDDDLSSIRTPSSRASSRKSSLSPKKDVVDPWISSPPYEFAYPQFVAAQRSPSSMVKPMHVPERGRTLVRV